MRRWLQPVLCALLTVLVASLAGAQYTTDYEALSASPAGTILTSQDGYYVPVAGSIDFLAYTYAGNALGLPQNPEGGAKFVGGTGPGGTTYARAQRDVLWGDGTGMWKQQYDFCATYSGAPPGGNNLGSFSIRYDDANVHNIHLFSWVDLNVPTTYNAFYLAYDASGVQFAQPGESPGAAWEGLQLNHWYRAWTTYDLDTNLILEVGIIDLETMVENTFTPVDWFLVGGSAGAIGPPMNFRLFAGGSVAGNSVGWDNVSIEQPGVMGACCLATGCQVMTEDQCTAAGGSQFIPNQDCDPDPCFIPTQTNSWGQIKNSYR